MTFVIQGDPIAWARPGVNGQRDKPFLYDTQKKERLVVTIYLQGQHDGTVYTGPLVADMTFFMRIPKNSKTIKEGDPHISCPDVDNMVKFILDCGKRAGLYSDDRIFFQVSGKKVYSHNPRVEFTIIKAKYA